MRPRSLLAAGLAVVQAAAPAAAFQQPPLNFGATSFLDGGGGPPGLYLVEYVQHVEGAEAVDSGGNAIPGGARVSALVNIHQVYWLSPMKVLGANLGLDVLLPVVAPGAKGGLGPFPVRANTAGIGDLIVGPALQWNGSRLFGAPLNHRVELNLILPTGKYDAAYAANPGSNLKTVEAYYAFTWLPSERWEASGRLNLAVHNENPDTDVRPGTLFHMNLAVSRAVAPPLRLGVAGYLLQQLSEDRVGGAAASGSKERMLALGPGVVWLSPGLTLMLTHPVEFSVENRFRGSRTTLQLIYRF